MLDFNVHSLCARVMNIVELKCALFTDLKDPIAFLSHKKMTSTASPTYAKRYGGTTYFYAGEEEWRTTLPECRVQIGKVNAFSDSEHTLSVSCPDKWTKNMTDQLKVAARLAFDSDQVQKPNDTTDFETFWKSCRVPQMLTIETFAYTKRGRRQIYIPVFYKDEEITGRYRPEVGDIVSATVRWHLCQSMDNGELCSGFRPMVAGGIQIVARAGIPPPIKRPWAWDDVNFNELSVPMYHSMTVKVPCMRIEGVQGNTVKCAVPDEFAAVMHDFHELAGVAPWSGQISLHSALKACSGARLLATIVPIRNNAHIEWTAVKHRILPNQPTTTAAMAVANKAKAGEKRRGDNTDTSCSVQTKRQCI